MVNVLDGRREVRSLHARSLALVLQRHRRLETRIRSLEQALHRQRHWRGARFGDSSSGTSESTSRLLSPIGKRCSSSQYCSREAVFLRRLHHKQHDRLRFVEWCLVKRHRNVQLAPRPLDSSLAGSSPSVLWTKRAPHSQLHQKTLATVVAAELFTSVICFTSAAESHPTEAPLRFSLRCSRCS